MTAETAYAEYRTVIGFSGEQFAFLQSQRVGRLATADLAGAPHVVPVCYACDQQTIYIPLDSKPKRVSPLQLKRVRNIVGNPQVALVIDHYSEDWEALTYLLIRGRAMLLLVASDEHQRAVVLLRDRYVQYRSMPIDEQPVIAISATSVVFWNSQNDSP